MATRTVSVNLVANIGQYVSGMNTAAGATLRLGESARTSSAKAKSGFDLASKSGLLMGAAVVGGLGMAISKSMDFEKSMSAVAAATQATAGTLGDLREAAMKAGADTQYSATEAADAITEMAKAGVSAKDIMGGGLKGALSLAAAGQIDVAEAAGIASTAMAQFNLSGEDLPHVADLMAAGAGKAMGSVDDLGQALNQAGLMASASGLSIEETTGTLAAFANAGLVGSDAGTSLKTMLTALQAPSEKAAGIMSDLGINMYDAQGNMLGASEMAGQLQGALGGLTEEQRNSALATIFGTDAVRAANVLYKEGATGITEWTNKVNDQGYAAKQAAALNDNLSGDLEKLGGAFDTLMIAMGSGAQGPLRFLVQGFTDLLDGVTALGGPLKAVGGFIADNIEIAAALATVLGVQLLGGVGALTVAFNRMVLTPVVLGLSNMLGVALNLPAAMASASAAVGGFAAAAAPLVAIGAIVYATAKIVGFATAAGDARAEVAEMWNAVDDSRGTEQMTALGGVVDQIEAKIRGLKTEIGDVQTGLTGGLFMLDNGADIQALATYQDELDKAREAQEKAQATAATLGTQFHMTGDEVLALAGKYGIDLTGSVNETKRLFENFYAMEFGSKPTEATVQVTNAMEDAKTAVDDAKQAVDGFKLSLDILTGANVSMIQVESAFQAAVDDAKDAVKDLDGSVLDSTGSLNLNSEAGRKAADVLLGVRDSGNQLIATMIQQGDSADEVRAKDAQLRDSFYRSAVQMGIGSEAARLLTDKILGIPAERETKIDADTATANAKIAATQQGIDNMHGRTIEIDVRAAGRFIVNPSGGLQEFAEGGWTGRGSKHQPAGIVHADEFVVPKHRVNALGGPRAVGSLVGMPGYSNGGPVLPLNIVQDTRSLESTMSGLASAMQSATPADGYGPSSGVATASSSQLVKFGVMLQKLGARVSEHPAFGGVTMGAHVPGSAHYSGRAIDVNTRPGTSALEQRELAPMAAMARAAGFKTIFMAPGHYNHLHVQSYKTGTPSVPRDGLAYLHQGERVVPREQNLRSREFSGGGGGGMSFDYDRLAKAVGARSTSIAVTAPSPAARAIALKVRDVQQDLEFLHG